MQSLTRRTACSFTGTWEQQEDGGQAGAQLYAPSRLPVSASSHAPLLCGDGREEYAGVGALGGDMGELVLGLTALESARGASMPKLTASDVRDVVFARLAVSGGEHKHAHAHTHTRTRTHACAQDGSLPPMSLCTDETALAKWAASAGVESVRQASGLSTMEAARVLQTAVQPSSVSHARGGIRRRWPAHTRPCT